MWRYICEFRAQFQSIRFRARKAEAAFIFSTHFLASLKVCRSGFAQVVGQLRKKRPELVVGRRPEVTAQPSFLRSGRTDCSELRSDISALTSCTMLAIARRTAANNMRAIICGIGRCRSARAQGLVRKVELLPGEHFANDHQPGHFFLRLTSPYFRRFELRNEISAWVNISFWGPESCAKNFGWTC